MNTDRQSSTKLEPRVAKLEVGLDRLTDDVRDLANVVRSQGANMEAEIQKLVVAVTQAAGPRKTDWQTIIAGIALVLAIGSAVFWPMNQTLGETKARVENYQESIIDHQRLDNHPVGAALLKRVEDQLSTHVINNERQFKEHLDNEKREFDLLKEHFNEKLAIQQKFFQSELSGIQNKNDLYIDKLFNRVLKLENLNDIASEKDKEELMLWRQKAMGLQASP